MQVLLPYNWKAHNGKIEIISFHVKFKTIDHVGKHMDGNIDCHMKIEDLMDRVGKCFLATCHKRVSPTSYSLLGAVASLTFSKYEALFCVILHVVSLIRTAQLAVNDVGRVVL